MRSASIVIVEDAKAHLCQLLAGQAEQAVQEYYKLQEPYWSCRSVVSKNTFTSSYCRRFALLRVPETSTQLDFVMIGKRSPVSLGQKLVSVVTNSYVNSCSGRGSRRR